MVYQPKHGIKDKRREGDCELIDSTSVLENSEFVSSQVKVLVYLCSSQKKKKRYSDAAWNAA
jgi:hypothetical protein